jgi:uncharacterized protein YodC (DUF2158 family)
MSGETIKLGNHQAAVQFLKGDLCALKSGGPVMTVGSTPAGDVLTFWFHPGGQPMTGKFPPETLRKVLPADIVPKVDTKFGGGKGAQA